MPEPTPVPVPSPDSPVPAEATSWLRSGWFRNGLWVAGTIAAMYAMVYVDVTLRAKEAYEQGEQYSRWHDHPDEKRAALTAKFQEEKKGLDEKLARGKISKDEHERQVEILQFDRDRNLDESSIKYAYVWYKTAYELFSPPESKWVKLSREKAPEAREKWKAELRAKNIPFEEYMLD